LIVGGSKGGGGRDAKRGESLFRTFFAKQEMIERFVVDVLVIDLKTAAAGNCQTESEECIGVLAGRDISAFRNRNFGQFSRQIVANTPRPRGKAEKHNQGGNSAHG